MYVLGAAARRGRWRKERERQREKEKERREIAFLKRSETICCTEICLQMVKGTFAK